MSVLATVSSLGLERVRLMVSSTASESGSDSLLEFESALNLGSKLMSLTVKLLGAALQCCSVLERGWKKVLRWGGLTG